MGLDAGNGADISVLTSVDLIVVEAFARAELTWPHGFCVDREDDPISMAAVVAVRGMLSLALVRRGYGTLRRRGLSRGFTGVGGDCLCSSLLGLIVMVAEVLASVGWPQLTLGRGTCQR